MGLKNRCTVMAVVLALLICGCQGRQTVKIDRKMLLEQRVAGFINDRQARDREALRQYFSSPDEAQIGNINYKNSVIENITFSADENEAEVKLSNDLQAMGFSFKKVPQILKWRWEKENWYLQKQGKNNNPFTHKKPQGLKK